MSLYRYLKSPANFLFAPSENVARHSTSATAYLHDLWLSILLPQYSQTNNGHIFILLRYHGTVTMSFINIWSRSHHRRCSASSVQNVKSISSPSVTTIHPHPHFNLYDNCILPINVSHILKHMAKEIEGIWRPTSCHATYKIFFSGLLNQSLKELREKIYRNALRWSQSLIAAQLPATFMVHLSITVLFSCYENAGNE